MMRLFSKPEQITASFNMQALQAEQVPEPNGVLSLLAIGAGVALKRKRKNRLAV